MATPPRGRPRQGCRWDREQGKWAIVDMTPMAGIQAGVERYPALIRWTLYTVHWANLAKLYAMHGTVPYGLTPIGRSYK